MASTPRIRPLERQDCERLSAAFAEIGWDRGYLPDGRGAVDGGGRPIAEGARIDLDDDVTLRLEKPLRSG